jgi:hypothetical protein
MAANDGCHATTKCVAVFGNRGFTSPRELLE